MARRSKQTNGINTDLATAYISRVENLHAELASKRGAYMADCKTVREDIKEVYTEAKADGIPAKALKAMVKDREYDRKKKALSDGLDIDEQSALEQMQEALAGLGELPLGEAAINAQRRRDAAEFDKAEAGNGHATA